MARSRRAWYLLASVVCRLSGGRGGGNGEGKRGNKGVGVLGLSD